MLRSLRKSNRAQSDMGIAPSIAWRKQTQGEAATDDLPPDTIARSDQRTKHFSGTGGKTRDKMVVRCEPPPPPSTTQRIHYGLYRSTKIREPVWPSGKAVGW